MGNAIVNVFGFPPIKSKYTPSYKCKYFKLEKTNQLLSEGKYFNEVKVFYNMLDRNESVLSDKKNKQKNIQEINEFFDTIKGPIERLDLGIMGCDVLRLDLINAIDNKNIDLVEGLLSKLDEIAEKMESEDLTEIKGLHQRAIKIKELNNA